MAKRQQFLTPIQDIALNLAFAVVDESRINRTARDYAAIAAKMPPLKLLLHKVNDLLRWIHQRSAEIGLPLPQLCRFKAGDERYEYEDYPSRISMETLRLALEISGMREPRWKRAKSL